MTTIASLFALLFFVSCSDAKEINYTASTPASSLVRNFLGISLTDSIDFIRWKLSINENNYSLDCNYGIGKPNTNGFYNGGKKIVLNGPVKKEKNNYILQNGSYILKLVELNSNLLHILNEDNSLMIGNGGWSYAINKISSSASNQLNLTADKTIIKDSIAFQGRTPCGVPGVIKTGQCYKLKWYLVLYGNAERNEPLTYRLLGTGYRAEGGLKGKWVINTGSDGRITYELLDEKKTSLFHLVKLDEGVLIFTDANGNLLVGDHDFSYTLNRKF